MHRLEPPVGVFDVHRGRLLETAGVLGYPDERLGAPAFDSERVVPVVGHRRQVLRIGRHEEIGSRSRSRLADGADEPAVRRLRLLPGDLLTDHGADERLEHSSAPCDAQATAPDGKRAEDGVVGLERRVVGTDEVGHRFHRPRRSRSEGFGVDRGATSGDVDGGRALRRACCHPCGPCLEVE